MLSERISQRAQLCLRKTVVSHLKNFHSTCTRFGCSFLLRALYVRIFQLGYCMAQGAYSCTLKKGYARNVCALTNYDTLTCLTRVLTFRNYKSNRAKTSQNRSLGRTVSLEIYIVGRWEIFNLKRITFRYIPP